MSELQTRFIDDTYAEYYNTGKHELAQIYLKSEADKVIAHKDAEIAQLQAMLEERNKQVGELKDSLELSSNECCSISERSVKRLRHHKYKRCLAMAKRCGDAYDKWMMKKANAIALSKDGIKYYHQARWKVSHYMRWHKRWLELAEKFKEAK